ncbi:MAG TPA: TetR/AcrR family transcriptional regulator [Polyangia bacterium]
MATTTIDPPEITAASDARRRAILDAAVNVFVRYGFRKTSMEEVARAAQVSRQGLYLHFATKEDLFREGVQHTLSQSLAAATAALRDPKLDLEARLLGAFDAMIGRYVGMSGASATDLAETASALLGPILQEHEERFAEAVARTLSAGKLAAAYKSAGLTARELADVFAAVARGLKHSCGSQPAFREAMGNAVRALCLPLKGAR